MKIQTTFSFAILSDSHIRPPKTSGGPSDYPSNQFFNARNRFVVNQLNHLSPDFVIHLGDIPHPIPALPDYEASMQIAQEIFRGFDSRFYVVPGNHDVGDKPNAWTPAPVVTQENLLLYEQMWGSSYRSFDHAGCHFILINSPVLNSGLPCELVQRRWLEDDLLANQVTGKRVFVFTHYPVYLYQPNEVEHYDNIGEPARAWLLSLLEKYNISAVFSGHSHNFFYNRYRNTDLYTLPSVAFVRPEFSEMGHIEPALEYGRNDLDKLAFTLVHVDQGGYHLEPVRTYGFKDDGEGSIEIYPTALPDDRVGIGISPLGVSLRHAWASSTQLPFGNLEEFTRKPVRNDYPLLALWELGIRRLRVPLLDLEDQATRERVKATQTLGYTFTIFSVGIPNEQIKARIIQSAGLVERWEVITPWALIPDVISSIQAVKQKTGVQIVLSKLDTLADQHIDAGLPFSHFPSHGFQLSDQDLIAKLLDTYGASQVLDGFVFQIAQDTSPWEGIETASLIAKSTGAHAIVQVRMPRASEGVTYAQDGTISRIVAETLISAINFCDVTVFLDTFIDHDRGYYPRNGLLDRRYNPRPAYHVFRNLQRALGGHLVQGNAPSAFRSSQPVQQPGFEIKVVDSPGSRSFILETSQYRYTLTSGDEDGENGGLSLSLDIKEDPKKHRVKKIDLLTGKVRDVG